MWCSSSVISKTSDQQFCVANQDLFLPLNFLFGFSNIGFSRRWIEDVDEVSKMVDLSKMAGITYSTFNIDK